MGMCFLLFLLGITADGGDLEVDVDIAPTQSIFFTMPVVLTKLEAVHGCRFI